MVWFICTIPPGLISDACEKFDSSIMNCFQKLLGSGLSSDSLIQASLGTKNGGLGLRATKTSIWKNVSLLTTLLSQPTDPLVASSVHPVNKFFPAKLISIASNHFFLHRMLFIKLDCLLVQCLMPMLGSDVFLSSKRNFLAWNGQFPLKDGLGVLFSTKIISV